MMIQAKNVSMCYRMTYDRVKSIKEYLVQLVQGKIQYEEFWALKDISFEVKKGEVLGIIGHNGAGKSTLLKVISGILKPTGGHVAVNGTVVPMLELGSGFDFDLTGRENVFLNGSILGYSEEFLKEKYEEIVEFSELGQFIDVPLRNYSSGMVMRLAFSVATVVNPDILIVDEILAVGDADFQAKSKKRMLELMGGGTTVLFVSHSLEQIREMCDRVLWMEHGEVKMLGDAQTICNAYNGYTNTGGGYNEPARTNENQIKMPACVANIEISSVCNAKCRWCTTGIKNRVCQEKAQFMTPELFERGLDRLLELGWITKNTRIEPYNWGEPFLNPRLDDILKRLVDKGLKFCLSTNGSIYRKLSPDVLKNMDFLMISLPGMSQESYDRIHQLSVQRVHENIKRYARDLAEYGASDKLVLNFHVYQFNLDEIEDARHFSEQLGAMFSPHTAYFNDYKLCHEYSTEKIGYQDLYDASKQLFLDFYHPQDIDVSYQCPLWNQLAFDHEFNLVPCCFLTTAEQLGNLFADDPDELLKKLAKFPVCQECIVSGQSSVILSGLRPDWYNNTMLPKLPRMPRPRVYYDTGSGFSEDQILYKNTGKISQTSIMCDFKIPEKIQSLRFDPVEENGCLIRNLKIVNENGEPLAYTPINGKILSGGEILFRSIDPQILILFTEAPGHIHIESDIDLIM